VPARLCCREVGPRLGPQGALERRALDDQVSLQAEGATRYVGDHQARRSALRTRDVDKARDR
jgi:hypothetical protein